MAKHDTDEFTIEDWRELQERSAQVMSELLARRRRLNRWLFASILLFILVLAAVVVDATVLHLHWVLLIGR